MMMNSKNTKYRFVYRRKIIAVSALGIICLAVPVLMIFVDPIFIIAMFKLRFTKGSILHEMMLREMEAARLEVNVFNASNAERFLGGQDRKLRMQEVGPFIFQEYRTNKDLELDLDAGVVRFIPHFRTVFVEEESVGRPEEILVVSPNVPYLSTTAFFSSYPTMIKSVYSLLVGQLGPTPIRTLEVEKVLWGYQDNILDLFKRLMPGFVYYNTIGIFDRLYDAIADYRMEMDITTKNKFQVRKVTKTLREKYWNGSDLLLAKLDFQDTYEGAAFPPKMTPEIPLNIYRPGICKALEWEYAGQKRIKLGADAFLYQLSNKTFANTRLCDSKGLCPQGVLDLSTCFYGLPIGITKSQLLDVDPVFLERIDGLSPDPEKHSSYILIEPILTQFLLNDGNIVLRKNHCKSNANPAQYSEKIGLTVETSLSLQLNLVLGDLRIRPDLAKFSDLLLPIANVKLTLPELPAATKNSLALLYVTGPQILLVLEMVSCVSGLLLIAYSIKLNYQNCFRRRKQLTNKFDNKLKGKVSVELPLIN